MNDYMVPPANVDEAQLDRDAEPWVMQHDVLSALRGMGHEVYVAALSDDIKLLRQAIEEHDPDIVFNLLFEFKGEAIFDQNVMGFLELLDVPFTGSNPRALALARNKATAKKLMLYHDIRTPAFVEFPKGQSASSHQDLSYPLIVKCLAEDSSLGMTQSSLVRSLDKLNDQLGVLHERHGFDAIVEEFVLGRELFVGVMGNEKLTSFPAWELVFGNSHEPEQEFYHTFAKWNKGYRARKGIFSQKADLSPAVEKKVQEMAKQTYRALELSGYARIDFRMTANGDVFVIEANPNPDLRKDDEFCSSAYSVGLSYEAVLQRILQLGLARS